jgi:hypothetical protein
MARRAGRCGAAYRACPPSSEKGVSCRDFRIGLKAGTTLVRQWRGHAYTVLVREDGFEYEGQHYRSLTVIAERITGAHWSGPRFFGLAKHAQVLWSEPRPVRQSTRRSPEGSTVDEVVNATGWQRHTARGVLSGTLKKKLGFTIASTKEDRGRVYRIAEPASI